MISSKDHEVMHLMRIVWYYFHHFGNPRSTISLQMPYQEMMLHTQLSAGSISEALIDLLMGSQPPLRVYKSPPRNWNSIVSVCKPLSETKCDRIGTKNQFFTTDEYMRIGHTSLKFCLLHHSYLGSSRGRSPDFQRHFVAKIQSAITIPVKRCIHGVHQEI